MGSLLVDGRWLNQLRALKDVTMLLAHTSWTDGMDMVDMLNITDQRAQWK